MVVSLFALVTIIAVVTAILGSLVVYIDAQRRNEDHRLLWTGVTGLGFVFGVVPGLFFISIYFVVSRKL